METGFEPVYTDLQSVASPLGHSTVFLRADDGTRTRDIHLGKVTRYQLRYIRNNGGRLPDMCNSAQVGAGITLGR